MWIPDVIMSLLRSEMSNPRDSNFIKKQKELYKALKSAFCPALQETVYFTADGLNHLLYNQRRPRSYSERHYRAILISYLKEVVKNATQAIKNIKSDNPLVVTWSLTHICRKEEVKVILKKYGSGRLIFLSAMSKRRIINKNP